MIPDRQNRFSTVVILMQFGYYIACINHQLQFVFTSRQRGNIETAGKFAAGLKSGNNYSAQLGFAIINISVGGQHAAGTVIFDNKIDSRKLSIRNYTVN